MYFTGTQGCIAEFLEHPNGLRCNYISNDKLNFDDSQARCRSKTSENGIMAEIRDSATYQFVKSMLN